MTMHVGECAFYHSAFKRTDFESITFNMISSIFISMENIFQTVLKPISNYNECVIINNNYNVLKVIQHLSIISIIVICRMNIINMCVKDKCK